MAKIKDYITKELIKDIILNITNKIISSAFSKLENNTIVDMYDRYQVSKNTVCINIDMKNIKCIYLSSKFFKTNVFIHTLSGDYVFNTYSLKIRHNYLIMKGLEKSLEYQKILL